ncbi:disease resistance protein RPM1-like [Quercus suber]|uniref:disease resistance protein RPM1-like n=1 Tax=Quercus suber TaxID=58331 RepID=UPI0032DE36AF
MFPEAYSINCVRQIRLWIAEGFVKEKQGKILEDVAQDYLKQLIYRSLVQVEWVDYDGSVRTCRVHDMIREVIVSRSEELSCCHVSIRDCSSFDGIGRCLSIHNNLDTPLERTTSSKTRSIIVSRADEVPNSFLSTCFENFKLMKVMDFECAPITYIPKEVGNLFHLRYLSLRGMKVQMLPKSINKLHNLETLDLKRSLVSELPTEISGLCKLRYLAGYIQNDDIEYHINSRKAIKVPSGIGHLESLHKLYNVEACSNAFIAELGKLRLLRRLEITKLKRENGKTLCIALKKMSDLRSLRICATSEEEILELQSILANDPLKVLQALPNLMNLRFLDGYEGKQLHFEGGGFQKLKYLTLEKLGGLNRLKIDDGALPHLEKLRIGHSPHLKEVPLEFII